MDNNIMDNKSNIMSQYDHDSAIYQQFTQEVEHLLKNLISNKNIDYNAITCRLKDRKSLSEKIDRKNGKYNSLKDLTDIAGVRVITYYAEDVDKVADIVEHEFKVDHDNSIDKGKALEPDRFGYCSVHYVVEMSDKRLELSEYQSFSRLKCEIQIRSVLQHAWAEIEHDLGYKSEIAIPKTVRRGFSRLAGLLEIADKEFQDIRRSLSNYESEVPKIIENNEDVEIDAVLLSELAKTNKDIIAINEKIKTIWGLEFDSNMKPSSVFESSVSYLQWFKINTLNQLYKFVKRNGDCAVKIAEIIFKDNLKLQKQQILYKNMAFLYLCYAELVLNEKSYNKKSFEEFFCHCFESLTPESHKKAAQYIITIRETMKQTIN